MRVPRAPHREKLLNVRDLSISSTAGLLAGSLARLALVLPLAIVVGVLSLLSALLVLQVGGLRRKKRRRVKVRTRAKRWVKRKAKLTLVRGVTRLRGKEVARASSGGKPVVDGMRPQAYPAARVPRKGTSQAKSPAVKP